MCTCTRDLEPRLLIHSGLSALTCGARSGGGSVGAADLFVRYHADMATTGDTEGQVYMCVTGAPADDSGVCVEHGETACVISVRKPT